MPTTTITALSAATNANLAGTAVAPVDDTTAATKKATLAQLRTVMFAGGTGYTASDPLTAGAGTLSSLTVSGAGIIGSSGSPQATLDVYGAQYGSGLTGNIFSYDTAAVAANIGGGIFFGGKYTGSTTTVWAGIAGLKENATDGNYASYLSFVTRANGSASVEKMRLDASGNLGIGVSPSYKLDVNGELRTAGNFIRINGDGYAALENSGTGHLYIQTSKANSLVYIRAASNSNGTVFDQDGNVGIGAVTTFGTSAAKVLGIANGTAPSTSPAGMGQLYVESGALKYRGSSGTVTTIANA